MGDGPPPRPARKGLHVECTVPNYERPIDWYAARSQAVAERCSASVLDGQKLPEAREHSLYCSVSRN
jgi:hypothetical protein